MEKRGCGETPSVIGLIRGVYKYLAISSELMARLARVRVRAGDWKKGEKRNE